MQTSLAEQFVSSVVALDPMNLVLGLAVLTGACVTVAKSRRPAVIAAYMAFTPLPLILAIFGFFKGSAASLSVLALSDVKLQSSEVYAGLAASAFCMMFGLGVSTLAYSVTAVGLFRRTCQNRDR
jgi:hypothetical protein